MRTPKVNINGEIKEYKIDGSEVITIRKNRITMFDGCDEEFEIDVDYLLKYLRETGHYSTENSINIDNLKILINSD